MEDSLRQKTVSGLVWTFLEKFALNAFGFIQGVILARLLLPSDYGLIAMTGVFFAISYALVDTGFTSALIRKKERSEIDYSTVYNAGLPCISVLWGFRDKDFLIQHGAKTLISAPHELL